MSTKDIKSEIHRLRFDEGMTLQEIANKFQVSSIPNFVVFKDGEKVGQFTGGMSADDFEEKLSGFLK